MSKLVWRRRLRKQPLAPAHLFIDDDPQCRLAAIPGGSPSGYGEDRPITHFGPPVTDAPPHGIPRSACGFCRKVFLERTRPSSDIAKAIFGLTYAQRKRFDLLAAGMDHRMSDRVRDALAEAGLVQVTSRVLPGRLPVTVKEPFVPIHVHMVWCEVCAWEIGPDRAPDGG
jgi:hypothetical protein